MIFLLGIIYVWLKTLRQTDRTCRRLYWNLTDPRVLPKWLGVHVAKVNLQSVECRGCSMTFVNCCGKQEANVPSFWESLGLSRSPPAPSVRVCVCVCLRGRVVFLSVLLRWRHCQQRFPATHQQRPQGQRGERQHARIGTVRPAEPPSCVDFLLVFSSFLSNCVALRVVLSVPLYSTPLLSSSSSSGCSRPTSRTLASRPLTISAAPTEGAALCLTSTSWAFQT